jgi:hypothetical protein
MTSPELRREIQRAICCPKGCVREDGQHGDCLAGHQRFAPRECVDAIMAILTRAPSTVGVEERREPMIYTSEMLLNGKYTWCIIKVLPRVETVIEEFGFGPDAYATAEAKLATMKAASPTLASEKEGGKATAENAVYQKIVGRGVDALEARKEQSAPASLIAKGEATVARTATRSIR